MKPHRYHPYRLTRRDFMTIMGLTTAGVFIRSTGMATPLKLLSGPQRSNYLATVAATHHSDYDVALLKQKIAYLFNLLGGIDDVIGPGDKVGIKINLTGGAYWANHANLNGVDIREAAWTHPAVLQAVGELLIDQGVTPSDIYIVEALWDQQCYNNFGYLDVQQYLGAQLVNLNEPAPYTGFANISTGDDPFFYSSFILNQVLGEIDAFVSIPKMKQHYDAGVTHSIKNLVGIVPLQYYQLPGITGWRSAIHQEGGPVGYHLPRSVCDINMARPVNLAVIDGIKNAEGGEGPWNPTFVPSVYDLLIAGKDPVATDSIASLAMGIDPEPEQLSPPAGGECDNHLWLASQKGMGTNLLSEIELLGDGAGIILGMDDHGEIASADNGIRLYPNYPNPFRSYTNIKYALKEDAVIQLSILDQAGRLVTMLNQGHMEKGEHLARFNASGYPSGIYYCRLEADGNGVTIKLIKIKD
jgi:uncharacterized protein (DUF362 family)